jgi:hypothetical protein
LLHKYSACFPDFHPGRAENRLVVAWFVPSLKR